MIEHFFNKPNVIILEDGILKEGRNIKQVSKIYLFKKTKSMKVQELGSGFVVDHIITEHRYNGYIYYKPSSQTTIDILKSLTADSLTSKKQEKVMLIADSQNGKLQYQIKDVSISQTSNGLISKFSAASVDVIFLHKNNKATSD